jgi:hypothetical protein
MGRRFSIAETVLSYAYSSNMDQLLNFDWSFIDRIGDNPFVAMWFILLHGGWIIVLYVLLWGFVYLRKDYMQNRFTGKKTWIVLSVQIPRMHEQTPRAVENAFAYIAGMHSKNSWTEEWIDGRTQDTISFEIVSIDGHVQFVVRTTRNMRNITEAAIYSQYPDAEIAEIEDYARKVPSDYPDETWDAWGTEMIPVRSDVYPLRTYPYFEDKVSGEFKDPLSALLEGFSRLGPGEQAWYQIVLTPIDQKAFMAKAEATIKKLKGEKVEAKRTILDEVVDFPLKATGALAQGILGSGDAAAKPKKDEKQPLMFRLSKGEQDVLSGVENKMSKIVYLAKIRFLYVAKKNVLVKSHAVHPFIGAMKQFNTNNMLSVKPESKKIGVTGTLWFFKKRRNNERKHKLIVAYRNRSNWFGTPNFHLCIEELASLWHFPHSMQVKAPQLHKTESKRSEPPANIPFA